MAELRPCPFCGCKDIVIDTDGNLFSGYEQVAKCQRCGASISRLMCDPELVTDAWNQRASTETETAAFHEPTGDKLTDTEQRLFLAAMGRQLDICAELDHLCPQIPLQDKLVYHCNEIIRKVKGALWEQSTENRQFQKQKRS